MSTNVTRITNTGNLLVNGTLDEFTGAPVIDGNVVLWLDAGQTASYSGSGTTWTNLANSSLNTTLVNSPTFNTSGWLTFNGTTQYANTGLPGATTFTTDSDFSIACWINFTSYKAAATSIGTIAGAFNYQGYGLYWNGTPTTYTIGSYMRYVSTVSNNLSSGLTPGVWYYAVQSYSRSGNFHRLYINGILAASTTSISGPYNTNLNSVSIGIGYGAGSDGTPGGGTSGTPLNGSVSQVMIYNRALTAAEVLQNYNALAGRYGLAANTSGTAIQRTTSDTVLAEQFNEVTYNTASPTIINQFTYTENFDNVAWAKGATAITANAVAAPNNTTTADKFNLTATTNQFYLAQNTSLTSGVTYTQSIYAKAGEQTILQITPSTGFTYGTNYVNFNLSTGAIQTQVGSDVATITSAGDGWYRCTYTQAATTTIAGRMLFALTGGNAGRLPTFAGSANSGIYIWGAQITASSVPEIYQPIAAANTLVSTGMVQRVDSSGNMYVSNIFDEFTGAPVINSNTVLWLDAAQTASYSGTGSTFTDLSGASNNLTLVNSPTFSSDNGGGSFAFNGSSQYGTIAYTASLAPTTGLTVACWAYLTNWNITGASHNKRMISKTESGGYNLAINDGVSFYGYVSGAVNVSGTYYNPRYALSSMASGWHNIVVTCDGRYTILYVDGVARETQDRGSVGTITYTNNNSLMYGAESGTGASPADGYWPGSLGPAMIYNRALTADEVSNNYNALKRRYGLS